MLIWWVGDHHPRHVHVFDRPETHSGFFVHYDNGQTAEVSWSFIRELPPKPDQVAAKVGTALRGRPISSGVRYSIERQPKAKKAAVYPVLPMP